MGHSQRLRLSEIRTVFRLLGDIRDLRNDFEAQQRLIIDGLHRLIGADQGFAVRLGRFAPRQEPCVRSTTLASNSSEELVGYVAQWSRNHVPTGDPLVDRTRPSRNRCTTASLDQVIHPAELRTTAIYEEVLDPARVADVLVCFYRRQPWDEIASYAFHRLGSVPRFEPRAHRVARLFIVELNRLYREGELEPTPPAGPELTPRQRQILPDLLAGQAPKQIARKLGLSTHTVRDYIKDLYRRVGVSGRDELMAHFIGQAGGTDDRLEQPSRSHR